MRPVKSVKPYHVVINTSGDVVEIGDGDVVLQDENNTVEWYDTIAERETSTLVSEWRHAKGVIRRKIELVEDKKSEQEYSGKAENAQRWMMKNPSQEGVLVFATQELREIYLLSTAHTHGDYTEEDYRWLSLDVEIGGKTPRDAAESILLAMVRTDEVDRGGWEVARLRTIAKVNLQ